MPGAAHIVRAIRDVVTSLTPVSATPTSTYTWAAGLEAVGKTDRVFDLSAADGGEVDAYFGVDNRQIKQPFTLKVQYANGEGDDLEAIEERIADDREQLLEAIESAELTSIGVQRVSWMGSSGRESDAMTTRVQYRFEVVYRLKVVDTTYDRATAEGEARLTEDGRTRGTE